LWSSLFELCERMSDFCNGSVDKGSQNPKGVLKNLTLYKIIALIKIDKGFLYVKEGLTYIDGNIRLFSTH
jgi:hypothetical protein